MEILIVTNKFPLRQREGIFLKERLILIFFYALGIILFPNIILKKPKKDRLIVFFLTGFTANLLDEFMINKKRVKYPVRTFKRFTQKSILFDYLIFPMICTIYTKTTARSKTLQTIGIAALFSMGITLFELLLEKKTKLIKWIRWSAAHNFISLTFYFLMSNAVIGGINKLGKLDIHFASEEKNKNEIYNSSHQ